MIATIEKGKNNVGKTLPDGWKWVKLGDISELNPSRPRNLQYAENNPTTFIPMPSVDAHLGEITKPEIKIYEQVKKDYTYFQEEDILFAKITPCMQNGKHAIARNLINGFGFGTTEFHVIRPKEGIVSDWIHRFLRQPTILEAATEHFTGSVGQQRIPISYLENLIIPLPPLAEQKRIVAILNEKMAAIDKARAATLAQIEAAKALPSAYLRQIFNSSEAQTWEHKTLGEIFKLKSGNFLSANLMNINGKFPVYGGNGINGYHDEFMFHESKITIGRVGALCGCIHITCPNSWITDNALYISEKIIEFDNHFMADLLTFLNLNKFSNSMAQPLLSGRILYPIEVNLPDIDKQKSLSKYLSNKIKFVQSLENILQEQLEAINILPAAILKQAFNGEL